MLFLSRGKSPSYLFKPGFENVVQTTQGNIVQVNKAKWVRFTPFGPGGGFACAALPLRQGSQVAKGHLETSIEAKRLHADEQELIQFLTTHEDYGTEFVSVDPDSGAETQDLDQGFYVPEAEGGYFCQICEVHLSNSQAKAGHSMSKAHQKGLKLAVEAAREKLHAQL